MLVGQMQDVWVTCLRLVALWHIAVAHAPLASVTVTRLSVGADVMATGRPIRVPVGPCWHFGRFDGSLSPLLFELLLSMISAGVRTSCHGPPAPSLFFCRVVIWHPTPNVAVLFP